MLLLAYAWAHRQAPCLLSLLLPLLQVPPCSTVECSFAAHYQQRPQPGAYSVAASVQHQPAAGGPMAVAESAAAFQVG
jgi:hypothetical protein